jgi:ethanolamine-phosphate phospho-lyase
MKDIKSLLKECFNISHAVVKRLEGYANQNFLIECPDGKYILKTYPENPETLDLVQAESEVLVFLSGKDVESFPKPVKSKNGNWVNVVDIGGQSKIVRLLSYLLGDFFFQTEHTHELFASFGDFLAQMNVKLEGYGNNTIKAREIEWDIRHINLISDFIPEINDKARRKLVEYFVQQYEENVRPISQELQRSYIHNDANDHNVLVSDGRICGIFDFGDMVYSFRINELAVAITYAIFGKDDPLNWIGVMLSAYHRKVPLQSIEMDVLYYLIAARLCLSVCNSAHSKINEPENKYLEVSEQDAWRMLEKWLRINPAKAKNSFRAAIGLPIENVETVQDVVNRRHQSLSPILSLSYSSPIYMEKAAFQFMYDKYGSTYLDAYNNIPHVGHSHPYVVRAGQQQMAKLNTNTRYLYDQLQAYCEKLLSKFPASLNKVFFVNSGSAASDLAIRMAKAYRGFKNIMVMEHGYHGNTQTAMEISDYKFNNKRGDGQKSHILKAKIPDTYRGAFTQDDGHAGRRYAEESIKLLKDSIAPVAAFISEPVIGCGGQVALAKGYLQTLYPAIRAQGGLCISDEVQTGFGRLGDYFWGYEAQEVIPDMVILGKPMGNGHPMGAVVCTSEVADAFSKGVEFFSSFGGNPVSCAIGHAVLDVIENEGLQENAQRVGAYYKSILQELKTEFDCIGDVRGSGLFLGVEIIKNPETLSPDTNLAAHIKNALREKQILISTDGPYDSVLKSKPPLCFNKQNAEEVVGRIREVLKQG